MSKNEKENENKLRVSGAKTKQRCDFARYLALGMNGKDSYLKAGYKSTKYAASEASRMKQYKDVEAAYHYWKAKKFNKLDISEEAIVRQYASIAGADVRDYFDKEGNPLPIHLLPAHVACAIKKFEVKNYTTRDGDNVTEYKYELYDKQTALKELKDSKVKMLAELDKENRQSRNIKIDLKVNGLSIKKKNNGDN